MTTTEEQIEKQDVLAARRALSDLLVKVDLDVVHAAVEFMEQHPSVGADGDCASAVDLYFAVRTRNGVWDVVNAARAEVANGG